MNIDEIEWIAASWRATNQRHWAMSNTNKVLDHTQSDQGMKAIAVGNGDFETALIELIQPWLQTCKPAILSGLAQGRIISLPRGYQGLAQHDAKIDKVCYSCESWS
tara:strand:+ start:1634 stop:1951 length:318 start_codon:yes stop_codon:yes gene_type:complete